MKKQLLGYVLILGLLLSSPLRAFISPDPEGHVASMDLYSYCNGDPVNRYDPDGRVATGVLTGQSYNAASSVGSALGSSGLFGEARTLYQLSIGVNQATSLIENKAGFPSGSLNALPFALGPEAAPLSAAFAGIRYIGAAAEGLADFRALSTDAGLVIPAAKTAGSTADLAKGTTLARNLREQLAIEQAMSRPAAGQVLPIKMTDPRWPASDGWVKMQQMIKPGGEPINVHYLQNTATGAVDDIKIVIPGARP